MSRPESSSEIKETAAGVQPATPHHSPPEPAAPKFPQVPRRAPLRWPWLAVIVLVCLGVYFFWSRSSSANVAPTGNRVSAAGGGKKANSGAVPVIAARARKGNIGVYFS